MKNMFLKSYYALLLLFLYSASSFALEVETHRALNEHVATKIISPSGFSLGTYLKNQLGFQGGADEKFNSLEAWKWLRGGGEYEDIPYWYMLYLRSVNHFHNPLTKKGFSGIWGTASLSGVSSLIWAQLPKGVQYPGGYYSWQDTRDHFYNAFTSRDKKERERKFAEMFRGLGQVMHLIQDSSVPEHVRDDGHYFFYNYEKWVRDNVGVFSQYNPSYFNPSAAGNINPLAPVPIGNLFDTNQYSGGNPATTLQSNIGLSEYTSANFFSSGTIFKAGFPYPAWSSVVEVDEADAAGKVRTYLKKVGDGETINHLAVGNWFYKYLPTISKNLGLKQDDRVYSDYAALLIPRAVGYSAGLLNYFFRGTIEITAPGSYVYSITDGSRTPFTDVNQKRHQQFTHIKAKVKNTTPNEAMTDGILQAVARYKVIPNYSPDLSNYPPDGTVMKGIPFSYSVSAPKALIAEELSSVNVTPTEFTFDFTADPIPAGITDLYLQIVFKGTLGNEKDIAVAVGMKDLMEPTHHAFWNLTDMFSLYREADNAYHLYTAGQIMATPDLAALVDLNHNGRCCDTGEPYTDPYNLTLDIAYSGEAAFTQVPLVNVMLPAGRFIRLVVLVDKQFSNYMKLTWTQSIQPGSAHSEETFEGVLNQESGGVWQMPTPAKTFRSIKQHFYTGVLRCEPLGIDPVTGNAICPYPEPEAISADLTPYDQASINFP